jgi:hypothetical protein
LGNADHGTANYPIVFIGLILFYQNKSIHLWIKDMQIAHGSVLGFSVAVQQNFAA